MDHSDDSEDQRAYLPQEEQTQQQQRRQQQLQQQWPTQQQRGPGYQLPLEQQPQYPSDSRRQPGYRGQQVIPDTRGEAPAMIHAPPPPQEQDVDFRTQQHSAAVGYTSIHQSVAAVAGAAVTSGHPYGNYPQHFHQQPPPPHQQPPPPHQQMYHHQQHIPVQQPINMQQHMAGVPQMMEQQLPPPQPRPLTYVQPPTGRLPADRPLVKLSVSLIDTYKRINKVYYEERQARREARAAAKLADKGQGINNNGWDDENYDYIVNHGEVFYGRYIIKERIGKGSFGQVVRGVDTETNKDVAIKIIKSKKPFLMQAKTEIELLSRLCEKDDEDQNNIVRLLTHFIYRNHQCLVFEMLSLNLYELLKNTQFGGVSLNLIRKFAKQILKALSFLARPDVDIIHCDLKPENILLRHPKRSGVKVIDFGSSCRSNKRMYSYIQSRFYRSPEVMLGLPYTVAIDMWSLGCILAEMHTGEPLFSGSDQFDQMQKIVKLLGMVPAELIDKSTDQSRLQFFERTGGTTGNWEVKQSNASSSQQKQGTSPQPKERIVPSADPIATLAEVICAETNKRKKPPPSEAQTTARNYEMFVDLIHRMLSYDAKERISAEAALNHPFILSGELQNPAFAAAASPQAQGQSVQPESKIPQEVTSHQIDGYASEPRRSGRQTQKKS